MDRPVDPDFRKKQIIKRALLAVIGLAVMAVALISLPAWIKPSVSRNRIRTAVVERGSLEATMSASGTVVPEFEQVLSSPVDARIVKILKRPGVVLTKGEPIVELDISASPSPERLSATRKSCWPTGRPVISTARWARRSCASWRT
jgi:HlyD family secretion protein